MQRFLNCLKLAVLCVALVACGGGGSSNSVPDLSGSDPESDVTDDVIESESELTIISMALDFSGTSNLSDFAGRDSSAKFDLISTFIDEEGSTGTAIEDKELYDFYLESGPGWLSLIGTSGELSYNIPDSIDEEQSFPFTILVLDRETGEERLVSADLFVMKSETLSDGVVGAEGGELVDSLGSPIAIFEAGAASTETKVDIVRGRDNDGNVFISVQVDGDLDAPYKLLLPDPNLEAELNGVGDGVRESKRSHHDAEKGDYAVTRLLASGSAWFARVDREGLYRLPEGKDPTFRGIVTLRLRTVYELWGPRSVDLSGGTEIEPVLFVHGYERGSGLGGGAILGWIFLVFS